jgi:MFS transporter, PAT family, beta-lactamase induction signal transducer AmpG
MRFMNQRLLAVLLMGFASGLPLALVGSTLQAWFTTSGSSIVTIGTLSLVGLPYIWKFVWAPFMDYVHFSRLGRRRSWIVATQICMVVTIIVMAFLDPASQPWPIACLALGIAFFSASQDIAIDGYRTDIVTPDERGMAAALVTLSYRFAMLVSGAGALILAGAYGWRSMYFIMAGLLVMEMLVTLWSPKPATDDQPPAQLLAIYNSWFDFIRRKHAIAILIFIVIYKICDAYALALNTPFLLRYMHFSLEQVGAISKVCGLSGSLIGCFVGGLLLPSFGLYRSLFWFGILQMLSNLLYLWMAVVGKSVTVMAVAVFGEYFCGGLASVAFVAFLMGLCDRRFSATQYALLSALSAVGRVFVGPSAGIFVEHLGWVDFYLFACLIGLPSIFLLYWLNDRFNFSAESFSVQT